MKFKIVLFTIVLFGLCFGQDSLSAMLIDTIIKNDTLSIHDTILMPPEKCKYALKMEQKQQIDSICNLSKNTPDSLSRFTIQRFSDSLKNVWLSSFPEEAKFERQKSILKAAGILQIISSVGGIVFIAVDPQYEYSFSSDIPVYNPTTRKTETKNQTFKYKTGWQPYHTATLILSSGLFISGIITINF